MPNDLWMLCRFDRWTEVEHRAYLPISSTFSRKSNQRLKSTFADTFVLCPSDIRVTPEFKVYNSTAALWDREGKERCSVSTPDMDMFEPVVVCWSISGNLLQRPQHHHLIFCCTHIQGSKRFVANLRNL